MQGPPDGSRPIEPETGRLDSWKEIAAHLRRSISTVQRWEQQEGLPVRRHLHGKAGSVYAVRAEVDAWWESRRLDLHHLDPREDERGGRGEEAHPSGGLPLRGRGRVALFIAIVVLAGGTWLSVGSRPPAVRDLPPRASARAEADQAYQRGMYFVNRRQSGGCARAEPYLKQAIAVDPGFAEAHAELAFCYGFDHLSDRLSSQQAARLGREEAVRALTLDDHLSGAHLALGLIQHRFDYDWASAERSLRRAVDLSPTSAIALAFYAELLYLSGRSDEGVAMFRSAIAITPFQLDQNTGYGYCLFNLGKYDEAVTQFRKTLELDPSWSVARYWLAETLAAQNRRDEAVAEYLELLRSTAVRDRAPAIVASLSHEYAHHGWTAFWRLELALAEEDAVRPGSVWTTSSRTRPYYLARRHARLGSGDRAIAALQDSLAERAYILVFLARDPVFTPVRTDPRFQAIVHRVGAALP